jgi:GT2 family glycosyltransferase
MSENNLNIVIPTLNNTAGLNYLLNYFKNKQYEIIVISNKKKNHGFAGGVNKGAKDVKTKWMLILNDDIEFKDDITINKLIEYAEKERLDVVSPILRNPNGKVENYGYRVLPIGKIELVKDFSFFNSHFSKIDGLTAACLLIKTEVFKKLGGFDEKFFAYLEDVDFFLRFKKEGYKMGIAKIEVIHNHMITSKTMGNFKAKQDMVNWWRLFFKHRDKFKFDVRFFIERLRNISGYIKASL